ncbi:MAG: efflux RND transporter periplasmic adaptor subunit [Gammaproteobacteria bacterium]|nr:efflux RND transporter periplasmic adaptor subunit [Gammaproteobacteria bacterium]
MTRIWTIVLLAAGLAACDRAPVARDRHAEPHEDPAHEEAQAHDDEHAHDHAGAAASGATQRAESLHDVANIDPARAAEFGLALAVAGPQPIGMTEMLTGKLIIDPRRIANVRARFAGPVVAVLKDAGDRVRRGEGLARIESNDSLTVYEVAAPLAGVVLARHTSIGDVAGSEPLFSIGDPAALQAELQAFGAAAAALRPGERVTVLIDAHEVPGTIAYVAPTLDPRTQARLLRATLALPPRLAPAAGQFVSARLELSSGATAAVAVPHEAVWQLDGRNVVFVPDGNAFRARPVTLGRRGAAHVEITAGLAPGESYVARGGFLLKAEIGKAHATHEH